MGVQARVRVLAADRDAALAAIADAFERMDELEWLLSDYRPESDVSRVNARSGIRSPAAVDREMVDILKRCHAITAATDGLFDVTVGPLVRGWRRARDEGVLPTPEELAYARQRVGMQHVELINGPAAVGLGLTDMALDFGGIGKGWAAREGVAVLERRGFPHALVSIGGDVAAGAAPPGTRGWRVVAGRDSEARPARLQLDGVSVSTSGDSGQWITIDGTRYAHIVDPRTGVGASARRAVTVIGPDAAVADALASALYLAGPEDAPAILDRFPGTAARFHEPAEGGRPARTVVLDPAGVWARATAGAADRRAAIARTRTGAPPEAPVRAPGRTARTAHPILGVPVLDLDQPEHAHHFTVVDREDGQYLGHPTTALLADGRTILCVYPKGHGRGPIVLKRSDDGGRTWSERLPVPENWATSQETPTLYRVPDPVRGENAERLIVFSGLHPIRMASSDDDGATWTPLAPIGDFGGIVATASLAVAPDGRLVTWFHDDGRFFAPGGGGARGTFTLYQMESRDAGRTWSAPRALWSGSDVHLCEPGLVVSPDGGRWVLLLRENRRRQTSHLIRSDDFGATWSDPAPLPLALTGDRHTARYAPDGRLFISFRDMGMGSPTWGDWVAWVGTWDELIARRPAGVRVRLQDNHGGSDCAYPGVECLPDGTIVTTTYGHWEPRAAPFILSCRLQLADLDAFLDQ